MAPRKPTKKKVTKKAAGLGKVEREAKVWAYYAKVSPENRAIGERLDAIIQKHVPGVHRAVKWNVPFYGLEGQGWFCAFAAFKNHCSVNFFRGVELHPEPPDGGVRENRRVAYRSFAEVDQAQLIAWVKQAAAIPGWGKL